MNDLLYFKWQTKCLHSTLAPGSATVALFSGNSATVIKRGGGNRRTVPVSLGLSEAERKCFRQWLVFDQRSGGWGFNAVSVFDFLQTAQSLVRYWCWWADFPTLRLFVRKLITYKQHRSSYSTLGTWTNVWIQIIFAEQSNVLLLTNWATVSFLEMQRHFRCLDQINL